MIFNQAIRGFIRKEFKQVLRDPRMWAMLIFGPVIQLTVFGFALSSDVKNIRLTVVSAPGDYVMQDIRRNALSSGYFIDAKSSPHGNPFDIIQSNEADAVLVAPVGGLTKAIGRGEGKVQLLVDASNVTKAEAIENYAIAIVNSSAPADVHRGGAAGAVMTSGIQLDTRVLYNPSMESAIFLVPGVLGMLTCILPVLLTAMAITKEKEDGTFEMLISAPIKPRDIIIGKTVPYVILGLANLPFTLPLAYFVFGVPMRGSMVLLAISFLTFIFATVCCGVLISTVTKTQQQSMMGGFLFMFPALMLSGMLFPIENMPIYMRVLAYIDPLTYFLRLIRNIMIKGGDPWLVAQSLFILMAISVVVVTFTFRRFHTTIS